MKSFFITLLVGSFTLWSSPTTTNTPATTTPNVTCEVENTVFTDGEEITYSLYYNLTPFWIKAGEVTFTVSEEYDHYHVEAVGRTASSFEWFYKVHDVYTCDVDKNTLLPIKSSRNIKEGSYRKVSEAKFDFANNKVYARSGKTADNMKDIVTEMDDCMQDILSVIYHTRNLDFASMEKGSTIPANIFLDDEKYNVGFKYMGKETKKVKKLGKVDALVLKPQLVAGHTFDEDTEMTIWASDDGNRLPLMIESPVSVGSVKAVLKKYKNLRHPLEVK